MPIYDVNGTAIPEGTIVGANTFIPDESTNPYDKICKSINHRGWRGDGAVENSLAAYKASKDHGYYYVETDVRFTADDVAVLYHNDEISGTYVSNMTYAQVLAAVPTIAIFADFVELCRDIGVHPYIELKWTMTQTQVNSLVDTVHAYQMQRKVTWFGNNGNVSKVQSYDTNARLGILANTITSQTITQASALKLNTNEVFLDTYISYLTSDILSAVKAAGLPLEVFTFASSTDEIVGMDRYITGFTSDDLIAGKVLEEAALS